MASEMRLLRLVNQAANKLASVDDVESVLRDVLAICVEAAGAMGGTIYLHEPSTRRLKFKHVLPSDIGSKLERLDIPDNFGVAGEVFQARTARINEFPNASVQTRTDFERKAGVTVRSMLTMPLMITGAEPLGVIQIVNKIDGNFDEADLQMLDIISDICALAVSNSRLMERRRQVAALEGMGRAAHDLANKAGVLVTFLPDFRRNLTGLRQALKDEGVTGEAWLYLQMLEGTFEDVFEPYSDRVYRYARLVNNLAAGRPLEPKKKRQDFAAIVREAAEFMEPQAREARALIQYDLASDAPEHFFDDLYVMRIVENLVGNAIKAVAESVPAEWKANHPDKLETYGVIRVNYRFDQNYHVLEISDSGPGMSPQTVREILEGSAKTSWANSAGSGLGTKVVLDLAATHDARLQIDSRLGEGTTFRLDFPHVAMEVPGAVGAASPQKSG